MYIELFFFHNESIYCPDDYRFLIEFLFPNIEGYRLKYEHTVNAVELPAWAEILWLSLAVFESAIGINIYRTTPFLSAHSFKPIDKISKSTLIPSN